VIDDTYLMIPNHAFADEKFSNPENEFWAACSIHGSHTLSCKILGEVPWERGRKQLIWLKELKRNSIVDRLTSGHFREVVSFI
jgi:hypothetical protein